MSPAEASSIKTFAFFSVSEHSVRLLLCLYFLAAAAAAAAASQWSIFSSFATHGKLCQKKQLCKGSTQRVWFLKWLQSKDCSKCRFLDFYAVGIFVTCCCLLGLLKQQEVRLLLPLLLLMLHLLRRFGEQLLLVASDETSRMHLFAYVFGCT